MTHRLHCKVSCGIVERVKSLLQICFCPFSGQIAASLAALNRTVDDYDSMAKREMVKSKREKASL